MKKLAVIVALSVLPWAALAQGVPQAPVNPEVTAYQQLLTEANDRLAKSAARAHQLEQELQVLRSRLASEAKKTEPKSEQK